MRNDEKGFSIVELLSIIVITSVIIIPLMTTFVNFFEINDRMHNRRNAVGIADVLTNSVERLDYTEIYTQMHTERTVDHLYMMMTMDDNGTVETADDHCSMTFTNTTATDVCELMFTMEYNNMSIPAGDIQFYFFDYNLSSDEHATLQSDATLPEDVRDAVAGMPTSAGNDVASIMRYVVYVIYSNDPHGSVVLDGVFIND